MTKRFRGGIISAQEVYTSPSGGSGVFSTTEQLQKIKSGVWQIPLTTSMQFATSGSGGLANIHGYVYSSSQGFGTKYSDPSWTTSVQNASGILSGVQYSPSGNSLLLTSAGTSGKIYVSSWSSSAGYGTMYSTPANPPNTLTTAFWSPSGNSIVVVASGYLYSYGFNTTTGLSAMRSGPVPYMGSTYSAIVVAKNWVLTPSPNAPYYQVFPYSETDGFTSSSAVSQTTNFGSGASSAVFSNGHITVSPDETILAGFYGVSNTVKAMNIDNTGTFGSVISTLTTLSPGNNSQSVRFSKNQQYVGMQINGSPFLAVYPWNSTPGAQGFGTKYSGPTGTFSDLGTHLRWAPDTGSIMLGYYTGASGWKINAWQFSPGGFGTQFAAPATIPSSSQSFTGGSTQLAISPQ